MEEAGVVRLRVIRGLGNENNGIDRGGFDRASREQPTGRIGAQVQGRLPRGCDQPSTQADRASHALQGDGVLAGRNPILEEVAFDRAGRHGEAGEAERGEG